MLELEFFDSDIDEGGNSEVFNILDEGEPVGFLQLVNRGNRLHIVNITDRAGRKRGRPLGVSGVREVLRLLKKEFPLATQISGLRVSGARTSLPTELQEVTRRIR